MKTAEVFKALGDETRLNIIRLIAAAGNRLCVGMLAQKLGISQPAVSQHLKTLRNAGLIVADREGLHVHYVLADGVLEACGINTAKFLQSIGANLEPETCCELKGDAAQCKALNE